MQKELQNAIDNLETARMDLEKAGHASYELAWIIVSPLIGQVTDAINNTKHLLSAIKKEEATNGQK